MFNEQLKLEHIIVRFSASSLMSSLIPLSIVKTSTTFKPSLPKLKPLLSDKYTYHLNKRPPKSLQTFTMGCFPSRPTRRRPTTPTYPEPEYDLAPVQLYRDEVPYHASYQLHQDEIQSRQDGELRRDAPEKDVEALTVRLEVLAEEWDMDRLDGDLRREGYNAWKGGLSR